MATPDPGEARPPAKPWRVYGPRGLSSDHPSKPAAYEAVGTITRGGGQAKVYHWEDGCWRLHERIEPATGGDSGVPAGSVTAPVSIQPQASLPGAGTLTAPAIISGDTEGDSDG